MRNIFKFISGVKAEGAKIVWPKKSEVIQTTWFVVLMSFISALFFIVIDGVVIKLIKTITGV